MLFRKRDRGLVFLFSCRQHARQALQFGLEAWYSASSFGPLFFPPRLASTILGPAALAPIDCRTWLSYSGPSSSVSVGVGGFGSDSPSVALEALVTAVSPSRGSFGPLVATTRPESEDGNAM